MSKPIFIALLCMVLCACETPLDFQDPESYTPSLVITDYFTPDSIWSFRVSRSIDLSQPAFPSELFIENATVFVQGASGYQEELIHTGRGVYRSESGVYPQVGEMYTIEVESPGYESVYATSHAPELKSEILEIRTVDPSQFGQLNSSTLSLRLKVTDLPDKSVFRLYLVRVFPHCQDREFEDTTTNCNSNIFGYKHISFTSSEASFYHNVVSLDQPPSPFIDSFTHFRNAYFSDRLFQNTEQEFELFFESRTNSSNEYDHFMLVLSSLSEELVFYERSETLQRDYLEYNDYFLTTPVELYSNVEGGLGIFAGYSSQIHRFDSHGREWKESDFGIGE